MPFNSYRQSHQTPGKGVAYRTTYESGYYAAQWRNIEEPLLRRVLSELRSTGNTCLDFACGTGRISRLAAEYFDSVTGVDVSAAMLQEASVPSNVELLLSDITIGPLNRKFHVALAFRFFLNADEALRIEALHSIHSHLVEGGHLVCNIHMARSSLMGRAYEVLKKVSGRTFHNTVDYDYFARLIENNGFEVKHVVWYSFLPRPGPLLPVVCEALMTPFERLSWRIRIPSRLAQSFLVIAKKRGG